MYTSQKVKKEFENKRGLAVADDIFKKNKFPMSATELRAAKLQKKLNFFILYSQSLERKIQSLDKQISELKKILDSD
jgi:hypothetical protein